MRNNKHHFGPDDLLFPATKVGLGTSGHFAALGEKICRTPEGFKAWSQNHSHENVLTTFTSYGVVAAHRQVEILDQLRNY